MIANLCARQAPKAPRPKNPGPGPSSLPPVAFDWSEIIFHSPSVISQRVLEKSCTCVLPVPNAAVGRFLKIRFNLSMAVRMGIYFSTFVVINVLERSHLSQSKSSEARSNCTPRLPIRACTSMHCRPGLSRSASLIALRASSICLLWA